MRYFDPECWVGYRASRCMQAPPLVSCRARRYVCIGVVWDLDWDVQQLYLGRSNLMFITQFFAGS